MLLSEASSEWLIERRSVGRTIGDATYDAYQDDLRLWWTLISSDIQRDPDVDDLTPRNIKRALAAMHAQGRAASSRSRILTTLRGLCRYLVLEGKIERDPTIDIRSPKSGEKLPVAFDDEQMARLLNTAVQKDPKQRPPAPELDVAILMLLSAGGLRASEAAGLDLGDYSRSTPWIETPSDGIVSTSGDDDPVLRVTGKGNKQRVIPVDPGVADTLDDYLDWRSGHTDDHSADSPFLVRPTGKRPTRNTISYRVDRLYARAGIRKPDGEAAHALRHTYAMSMINMGVPINNVQALLGHESVATTGIYLRATGAQLREDAAAPSVVRALKARQAAKAAHRGRKTSGAATTPRTD
jgi:site-specific recombinase XerD